MVKKVKFIKKYALSHEKASMLGWSNSDGTGKHITIYEVHIFNIIDLLCTFISKHIHTFLIIKKYVFTC